ncbi:FHA domain-containing protein [Metabacillus halosaccharovorans]|uniref:FHA domain-containing protein n=1 Tax=Metabacillus halosaccharovorans TaxID=930124 RepID=UPI000994FC4F|nr:FHA domain-containing protein [Metabacillus halosaccharovorans]
MDIYSYLVVQQAPYFESGDIISLHKPETTFGRKSSTLTPDISFNNIFVSRKHFTIFLQSNNIYIKDLASKHGTYLNDKKLNPFKPVQLKTNDKISFAKNLVVLSFSLRDFEQTSELSVLNIDNLAKPEPKLDFLKQTLHIQNDTISLTEKEFKFIDILLQRKTFISREEIIEYVWPERQITVSNEYLVGNEEVNALIYRLRKKLPSSIKINTIRGRGYTLTMKEDRIPIVSR